VPGGSRKNDNVRAALFHGAVIFVEKKVFRLVEDGGIAEQLLEFVDDARMHLPSTRKGILSL
jgi:hypothetical protein